MIPRKIIISKCRECPRCITYNLNKDCMCLNTKRKILDVDIIPEECPLDEWYKS